MQDEEQDVDNKVLDEDDDVVDDVKKLTDTSDRLLPLKKENASDAVKERNAYLDKEENIWIQKFFNNNNYNIIDNEGDGDCLFAAIRDALIMVKQSVTVEELRKLLAKHANQEIFSNYRKIYLDTSANISNIIDERRLLKKQHETLKKRKESERDRNIQGKIVMEAKEIKDRSDQLHDELLASKSFLKEYKFMKGINTLEAFKAKLQTCDFWGETWAISTLEKALNIKLILFSKEAYENNDLGNVLQCGQLNDSELEDEGKFNPQYYIMLEYTGYHYTLVTYKNRGAITFDEIPYDVKKLVVEKCLEKQGGAYYLIEDFRNFMESLHIDPSRVEVEEDISPTDLYDKNIVFQFYSKSNDKPKPGFGSGEKIPPEDIKEFNKLASISKWRKKLSNFWDKEFTLDDKRWLTVEHYYQASKFKRENPDFYNSFSLNSGSKLSKSPSMAKEAGSKMGKYNGERIRPKSITVDNDFYTGRNVEEMENAMMAKFSQNPELKDMLLSTKNAKLQHYIRGSQPEVYDNLMRVRKVLRE